MDCLRQETVSMSGRSGCSELCSIDQTAQVQRVSVLMWGGPCDFASHFAHILEKYSSWRLGRVVPMIRSAVRTTLRSLLRSDLVAGAEPDRYWRAEDGFSDGCVEYQGPNQTNQDSIQAWLKHEEPNSTRQQQKVINQTPSPPDNTPRPGFEDKG